MTVTEYAVAGMTCANCERHVREEVELIPEVVGVEVDHRSGRLSVSTVGAAVPDAAVRAAVETAGYSATAAA